MIKTCGRGVSSTEEEAPDLAGRGRRGCLEDMMWIWDLHESEEFAGKEGRKGKYR